MSNRWFIAGALLLAPWPAYAQTVGSETVHVAPPTGEREADRASILTALEEVEPGGTILFAPGTYLVGESIRISVPQVILQGHADGTILRGCEPAGYPEYQDQLLACNGLELAAGHQTVRNLTIEHAWHGIYIGCCFDQVMESVRTGEGGPPRVQPGGHLIEDNRLRSVGTAMRVIGESSDPIVIRRNVFRNVAHALVINGGTAHVLDNDISAPEPGLVPAGAPPIGAIGIFPAPPARECGENVIAGNRIEGHPDGIGLTVGVPGTRCERNIVRDNTIIVRRVPIRENPFGIRIRNESDSTVVGIPIRVTNMVGVDGALPIPPAWELEGETVIGWHEIEGNRVMGADGLGIEIRRSSGNRISENVVTGIEQRDPFPGNLANSADPESWRGANGSGIWVSPGSDENEIVGNTFEDIATHDIVIEGDRNAVQTHSGRDSVRDLGSDNSVTALDPGNDSTRGATQKSMFVETPGVRLHYLNFGGSGLPVIFVHGSHGDAHSFATFASRFADGFRVLALDRRGRGQSEDVPWGYDVPTQGEDLLDLMDALGLERAVLVGNVAGPADIMTYLAEHHPERLAGLVFLAHASVSPWRPFRSGDEPVREFWEMAERTACDWDEETREREGRRRGYRPHFAVDGGARIDVPALSFVNPEGTRHPADFDILGIFLQQARTGEWCDEEAKAYFTALAENEERAEDLRARLSEEFVRIDEFRKAFERAFGTNLRIVRLEIPSVTGYEYRGAPDLIYPHIRRFLEGLSSR